MVKSNSIVSGELECGSKLLLAPVDGSKTSFFSIAFKAGGIYEEGFGKGSNDGISHFLEHMVSKRTHKGKTASDIFEAFTKMGAEVNAATSYDRTFFYSKTPEKHLISSIELNGEMFEKIILDPVDFDSEKEVVLQEQKIYSDMPDMIINFNTQSCLFKNTPLEHDVLGSADSVSNISREMMKRYIEKFYSLNNAIITVAGSFERNEIENKLNELFPAGASTSPKTDRVIDPWENWNQNWKGNHVYKKKPMERPLTYVNLAWGMPGTSSGRGLVMEMMNTMIGNSKTSLVYKEIIGKGIVPSVKFMAEFFPVVSVGSLKFVCPPDKAPEVFNLVMDRVLRKAKALDVTNNLIERLQDESIGDYLLYIEDPLSLGIDVMNRYFKYGKAINPDEYIKQVRAITPEIFRDTVNEIFDDMQFAVYAIGAIPENWEPALSLEV